MQSRSRATMLACPSLCGSRADLWALLWGSKYLWRDCRLQCVKKLYERTQALEFYWRMVYWSLWPAESLPTQLVLLEEVRQSIGWPLFPWQACRNTCYVLQQVNTIIIIYLFIRRSSSISGSTICVSMFRNSFLWLKASGMSSIRFILKEGS